MKIYDIACKIFNYSPKKNKPQIHRFSAEKFKKFNAKLEESFPKEHFVSDILRIIFSFDIMAKTSDIVCKIFN